MTVRDKRVARALEVIRACKAREAQVRAASKSRSTGVRNAYKDGYDTLSEVEEILNERPARK